jgi:hypothetical protein
MRITKFVLLLLLGALLVSTFACSEGPSPTPTPTPSPAPTIAYNDMDTGGDAGNTMETAARISLPASGTGYLKEIPGDIQDYYTFNISVPGTINVSMTPSFGANFNLCLKNPIGTTVASSNRSGYETESISYHVAETEYWFLGVDQAAGSGNYSLSISFKPIVQNDMNIGGDAGNTPETAASIALPATGTGYIDEAIGDSVDYYTFLITALGTISVSMTPSFGTDFDLSLEDPYGTTRASSTKAGYQADTISYNNSTTGYWFVRVEQEAGSGNYSLSISFE